MKKQAICLIWAVMASLTCFAQRGLNLRGEDIEQAGDVSAMSFTLDGDTITEWPDVAGLDTMAFESTNDYYTAAETDSAIAASTNALNLGTMATEDAGDYVLSASVEGNTTIADGVTLELSGATRSYYSHPTTFRTNVLAIAGSAAHRYYVLHLFGTNEVALSSNMVLMGDLPDAVSGRAFGFDPFTNNTWRVIGVAP